MTPSNVPCPCLVSCRLVSCCLSAAVVDYIARRFLSRKAKTQAGMNVFFQGAQWNLAERYTDAVSRWYGLNTCVLASWIVSKSAFAVVVWPCRIERLDVLNMVSSVVGRLMPAICTDPQSVYEHAP